MKIGFAAAVALAGTILASSSFAADMAVKAPPAAVQPALSWTGFYLGADAGAAIDGGNTRSFVWVNTGFNPGPDFARSRSASALGGFHGGFNWQISPVFLIGIEGDYDWTSLGKGDAAPIPGAIGIAHVGVGDHIASLATVRGRIGFLTAGALLYGTGGVAFTSQHYWAVAQPNGLVPVSVTTTNNSAGWVAGLGAEKRLADRWTVRVEWLHYGFKGETFSDPCAAIGCPGPALFTIGRSNIDSFRLGISYLLGPAPGTK